MSSDLMLDFVNPPMTNKEAGDICIDQDGEWGKIRFVEISITARAARDKRQLLYLLIVKCLRKVSLRSDLYVYSHFPFAVTWITDWCNVTCLPLIRSVVFMA